MAIDTSTFSSFLSSTPVAASTTWILTTPRVGAFPVSISATVLGSVAADSPSADRSATDASRFLEPVRTAHGNSANLGARPYLYPHRGPRLARITPPNVPECGHSGIAPSSSNFQVSAPTSVSSNFWNFRRHSGSKYLNQPQSQAGKSPAEKAHRGSRRSDPKCGNLRDSTAPPSQDLMPLRNGIPSSAYSSRSPRRPDQPRHGDDRGLSCRLADLSFRIRLIPRRTNSRGRR